VLEDSVTTRGSEVNPHSGVQTFTTLIQNGGGDLFGLAVQPGADAIYFVNDGDNTLDLGVFS
jgi:hypothetical protein